MRGLVPVLDRDQPLRSHMVPKGVALPRDPKDQGEEDHPLDHIVRGNGLQPVPFHHTKASLPGLKPALYASFTPGGSALKATLANTATTTLADAHREPAVRDPKAGTARHHHHDRLRDCTNRLRRRGVVLPSSRKSPTAFRRYVRTGWLENANTVTIAIDNMIRTSNPRLSELKQPRLSRDNVKSHLQRAQEAQRRSQSHLGHPVETGSLDPLLDPSLREAPGR